VIHTPKKGRIVIEYRGNDDLQRLLRSSGSSARTPCDASGRPAGR
jgi:hypothetical protein